MHPGPPAARDRPQKRGTLTMVLRGRSRWWLAGAVVSPRGLPTTPEKHGGTSGRGRREGSPDRKAREWERTGSAAAVLPGRPVRRRPGPERQGRQRQPRASRAEKNRGASLRHHRAIGRAGSREAMSDWHHRRAQQPSCSGSPRGEPISNGTYPAASAAAPAGSRAGRCGWRLPRPPPDSEKNLSGGGGMRGAKTCVRN